MSFLSARYFIHFSHADTGLTPTFVYFKRSDSTYSTKTGIGVYNGEAAGGKVTLTFARPY